MRVAVLGHEWAGEGHLAAHLPQKALGDVAPPDVGDAWRDRDGQREAPCRRRSEERGLRVEGRIRAIRQREDLVLGGKGERQLASHSVDGVDIRIVIGERLVDVHIGGVGRLLVRWLRVRRAVVNKVEREAARPQKCAAAICSDRMKVRVRIVYVFGRLQERMLLALRRREYGVEQAALERRAQHIVVVEIKDPRCLPADGIQEANILPTKVIPRQDGNGGVRQRALIVRRQIFCTGCGAFVGSPRLVIRL